MTKDKRTKTIKVRVSDDEHAALLARCTYAELAPWLRDLALGERKKRERNIADPDLLRLLSAAGNNLNQIARAINVARLSGGVIDSIVLLDELQKIEQLLGGFRSDN
jgi:hypothetical protein